MSNQSCRQAFLLLTNKQAPEITALYSRLRAATALYGETFVAYHQAGPDIPGIIREMPHFAFSNDILDNLQYIPLKKSLLPGSNHFPLLQFYRQQPCYDYYWYMEDDVRFNGDWHYFFDCFTPALFPQDFISSHICTYCEEPGWNWWYSLKHHRHYIPVPLRLRSFNPVYRISNAALHCIHRVLSEGWKGHHEVLMPTFLQLEGFSMMDFGGTGNFVLPGFENRFYTGNKPNHMGLLDAGTMQAHPVTIPAGAADNRLYHPVKIGWPVSQHINDPEKILQLTPEVKHNIFFRNVNNDDEVAVIDTSTGNMIGAVGQEELFIIALCTGRHTNQAIMEKLAARFAAEDVLDFLKQLFHSSIISFHLPAGRDLQGCV